MKNIQLNDVDLELAFINFIFPITGTANEFIMFVYMEKLRKYIILVIAAFQNRTWPKSL